MPTAAEAKIRISAVDKTKQAFKSVDNRLRGMGKQAASLKGAFGLLGSAAIVRGFDQLGKQALQANIQFENFANRLGASAGGLSELAVAGDLAGVAMTQVNMAVQRSTRRIGEAAQGYGEAREAIKKLNLEARDLANLSADEQFNELADALLEVENRTERLTLAFKLFDSEGTAVVQMLDKMEQARKLARESGAVITDKELNALRAYREQTAETEAAWRSFQQAFVATRIPETLENIKQGFVTVAEAVVDSFSIAGKFIGAVVAQLAALGRGDLTGAVEVWRAFKEDFDDTFGDQSPGAGPAGGGTFAGVDKSADKVKRTFQDITTELGLQIQSINAQIQGRETQFRIVKATLDAEKALGRQLSEAEGALLAQLVRDAAAASAALKKLREDAKKTNEFAEDIGLTFSSSFEQAIIEGEKLRDVLKGLLKDILAIIARKVVTEPLGAFVSGGIDKLLPGFAGGTSNAPGGLALVGERGPEIVNLPAGSQVTPNNELHGLGMTVNVDARGSTDPHATETAVRRAVRESISTMRGMKVRGQLPEFA